MFGDGDVSIIFFVNCKLHRNLFFAKTTQRQLYFRENNINEIESQVSESVKMLAITFKYDRMPRLKIIHFAIVKRTRRYFDE